MGINLNQIDAIIFDLGGVILNLDYNKTINAFKRLGGDRFDELYTQAYQSKIIDNFEIGEIGPPEFIAFMKSYIPAVKNDELIVSAWNEMLLDLPAYRIDFLRKIAQKKRTFLFSNTNAIHIAVVKDLLEKEFGSRDLFDEIFEKAYYSHTAGKRKPNADAFELVINENQLNPQRTLFIDDSIQHIEGAGKLGIQTYHLQEEDIVDIFDLDQE
jgi:HAD superfamily hydrolase (TIGR01509 family)